MARKNSNAKISDLINSENTQNHREILNMLTHLLSINVGKDESLLTPNEIEIKQIFADQNNQMQLGKICFAFISKFSNTEDFIQGRSYGNNVMTKKQKILKITARIINLLEPSVLLKTMDPHCISRQLRSFLVSHLHSEMADSGLEQYTSSTPAEEQYYLCTLSIIHKLITKNIPLSEDEQCELTSPNYFCIPMIREGILDTINDMHV